MNKLLLIASAYERQFAPLLSPLLAGKFSVAAVFKPKSSAQEIQYLIERSEAKGIICACEETLPFILKEVVGFRHPLNKNGSKKKLKLDDYAGSFFRAFGVDVLVVNPLDQLHTMPEAQFIFKRFLSKFTDPQKWYAPLQFTWEVWEPRNSAKLLELFETATLISIDIETFRDDPVRKIRSVGYCGLISQNGELLSHTVVIPYENILAVDFVRKMNSLSAPKIMQGGIYDNAYFLRFNSPVHNYIFDTLHLFHCWYSELPKSLDFLGAFFLREIMFWKDDAAGSQLNALEYNARDCWVTLHVFAAMLLEAPAYAKTNYLIEFPLVFPCLNMELDGLRVDEKKFDESALELAKEVSESRARLQNWFGALYNPNSSPQNKRLLKVLGVPNPDSADADALLACSTLGPLQTRLMAELLSYKKKAKLLSTYFVKEKFWNGRLHYRLDPGGTETGRLASSESSFWCGLQIQNIPRGKVVKSYIISDEGWIFGENDAAQSESRCTAYASGCTALIAAVESPRDFHKTNASAFFGVPYEEISDALRTLSKRVNHGANYNMGPLVLLATMGPENVLKAQRLLGLSPKLSLKQVCEYLLNTFAKTYPEVKGEWYTDIKFQIARTRTLVSPLGWTRYFFGDPTRSKPALNAAVAHGPQNLSVQLINKSLYAIWLETLYGELRGKIRLKAQVHDSIFYEYRIENPEVPAIISKMMIQPVEVTDTKGVTRTMIIPNDCNMGGLSWSQLK